MTHPWWSPFFPGWPVVVEQKVVWGDMDSYGHVNNVVYFRYFENARLEYLERLDWVRIKITTGVGPILASTQARFRRALTYPDTVAIGARVHSVQTDRFTLDHQIVSQTQQEVVTLGQGVVVSYHYPEEKKTPLPEEIRRRLEALEKRAF